MKNQLIILLSLCLYSCIPQKEVATNPIKPIIDYSQFKTRNGKKTTIFSDDTIQNNFTQKNVIYKPKRQFIYTYRYESKMGEQLMVQYYSKPNNSNFWGRLVPYQKNHNDSTIVDKIGLYVYYGKGNKARTGQSIIKYEYFNLYKQQVFAIERTNVMEDSEKGISLEPFRSLTFMMNHLQVTPSIKYPIKIGNKIGNKAYSMMNFGSRVVAQLDLYNNGIIPVSTIQSSEVVNFGKVHLPFDELDCYKLETTVSDPDAPYEAKADYYFNKKYGFVKYVYYDILNNCNLIVELEEVIDNL